jgi:hypothetical protein
MTYVYLIIKEQYCSFYSVVILSIRYTYVKIFVTTIQIISNKTQEV